MTYKRRYQDQTMQNAYMNACDCLYYGYSAQFWQDCGIDSADRRQVWDQACEDMTEEDD